ncbi:MAG: molybdopterin cofactor-binding domain-containing protein [Acidobacteriota bacterium]
MSSSRRQFLQTAVLGGAALAIRLPILGEEEAPKGKPRSFEPNKWITVGADGRITLIAPRSEMGQGARTSLAMILAEELEADWKSIVLEHAIPGPKYPGMRTSGSSSVSDCWRPLRVAGAAAREMLREAAARTWSVPRTECRAENSRIVHSKTGRRLDYGELAPLAATLPIPENPPLKDPKDYKLLGTRVARLEGPAIATGRAVYGFDARPFGALVAVVRRCAVPGGRARSFDASSAKTVHGVLEVVRLSTGVAVVASDTWAAMKGAEALKVDWDEGENHADSTETYWKRLEAASVRAHVTRKVGDIEAALAASARRLSAEYRYSFQAHAPVEPMNCFADVRDGRCEIRVGTQAPNEAQASAAKLLGIPLEAVTLHVTLLGGGFGRRLDHDYVPEAVELSRAIRRPVQVVWTRRDDFENDRFQPASLHTMSAGLDGAGQLIAWSHRMSSFHLTMFGPYEEGHVDPDSENPWGAFDCPYEVPALSAASAVARSPVPTGAWRAVDYPPSVFARESFLDEVAAASGRDPVALRLELLKSPQVVKIGSGEIDRRRLSAVIALAAEKASWPTPLRGIPGRRVGRGIAANVYHARTHMAQVAEVSVGRDGDVRVHRVVCAADCGQVVNLSGVESQVEGAIAWGLSAALKTEITFRNGRVEQHSFREYPVIRLPEMPSIETHLIASGAGPSGMGEQPVPPIGPAVANAIFAATGRRVRKLPVRADELRA